jgi:hypothetical protein
VDARRGNRQLQLRLRRRQDMLKAHDQGNIHQVLKTGACKGIISLNSNVVHDGLLWDVPAIVLGRNIWPEQGISPFILGLPDNWAELETFYCDATVTACRETYIHHLMIRQWYLADAGNPEKVGSLIERKISEVFKKLPVSPVASGKLISLPGAARRQAQNRRTASAGSRPRVITVNVVAKDKGWLFEDLKTAFSHISVPGIKIIASEKPRNSADTWLYLRASEVASSPDKSRTAVQIHDLFDDGLYAANGSRRAVGECGGICFTHDAQQCILEASGIDLAGKSLMTLPLGADRQFTLRQIPPRRFTVAWVGRPVQYQGRDFKRLEWFADALEQTAARSQFSAMLIGERLQSACKRLSNAGIDSRFYSRERYDYRKYANFYQAIDCLVITSEFAAGPNCLYEALASGIPVISTPCGWSERLIRDGHNGFIVDSPAAIANALDRIYARRNSWFERRSEIRRSIQGYSLDSWLRRNTQLAAGLSHYGEIGMLRRAGM